jgi:AbrB family looped-hinge helix DNA binding protein
MAKSLKRTDAVQSNPAPTGFADEQPAFDSGTGGSETGLKPSNRNEPATPVKRLGKFKVGPGGRVLVPADVRDELGVKEGDYLLASICEGELRLIPIAASVRRAQARLRKYIPDGGPSAVDELIAERRRENARDSEE